MKISQWRLSTHTNRWLIIPSYPARSGRPSKDSSYMLDTSIYQRNNSDVYSQRKIILHTYEA